METIKGNYYVSKNETFGRYMLASKSIKAGELILSEKPTLVGPQLGGPLICFNCCRNVTNSGYIFCTTCKTAPICSPKCTGKLHSKEECSSLKNKNINGEVVGHNSQLIFPLRCLLVKNYNSKIWETILELESHLEKRRDTAVWRRHKITVEKVLNDVGFISEEDLKEELVQKVCGILDVNTFEIRSPYTNSGIVTNPEIHCLRGLYLEAALMAHDCTGNTHLAVDDDFTLSIHASVDIPENSPIYFNYSNAFQGTINRKQHLLEGKYFECFCQRCEDPTELGTEISSLKCHVCFKDLIRSSQHTPDWSCNGCKKTFNGSMIKSAVDEGRRRIEEVDQSNVKDMENLLSKLLQTFHQNHYLVLELQQNLVGSYLRLPPNKKNLERKLDICSRLLEVFSKIELGLSRHKGITLYEMQSAIVDLAHKQYRDKEIKADDLTGKILTAESTLKEAIKHLLYEPPKSPEGRLAQNALLELKNLRLAVNNMQKDLISQDSKEKMRKKILPEIKPVVEQNGNTIVGKNNEGAVLEKGDGRKSKKKNRKRK